MFFFLLTFNFFQIHWRAERIHIPEDTHMASLDITRARAAAGAGRGGASSHRGTRGTRSRCRVSPAARGKPSR